MKHLKIKLSVLALACLGAGALALQPTANVKAEATPADCLTMVHGAAVYVSPEGAEKDFNGIRWTTKIDATKYTEGEFGTLVLPTSMLGDDGVLTHDDEDVLDLPANVDYANLPEVFYSIVSYDALGDNASAAYAMELTARSYVKVGDDYYYASLEGVNTSRSARQVALSTELAGEFEDDYKADKAAAYYGMTERYVPDVVSNGAAGTVAISLEVVATTEKKKLEFDNINDEGESYATADIAEVVIGAERIANADDQAKQTEYALKNNLFAVYVRQGEFLPTGEHYLTIFFKDGKFKTFPIVCATKILTTTDDLAMFSAKGGYYDLSTKASLWDDYDYWRPEQEQGGYYVLGKNIDASAYVHGSRIAEDATAGAGKDGELGTDDDVVLTPGDFNDSTWNGASSYKNKPIGLTGTFNGMGYAIDGMTMGSQREGFFGIVNGGTVKNVAFTDVKTTTTYAYVLANYLFDATVDNVYIATNKVVADDAANPGFLYSTGSALVANTAYGTTKISNVLLRLERQSTAAASTFGALFGGTHGSESFTCENVFAYVRSHFKYMKESVKTVDGVDLTVYAEDTAQYYTAMVTEKVAKRAKGESGQYTEISTKGSLYLAENQTLTALSNGTTFSANAYDVKHLTGVYYYGQNDTWGAYDPAGFLASGCWTAKSGSRPSWGA